jgi:hypothetical protein
MSDFIALIFKIIQLDWIQVQAKSGEFLKLSQQLPPLRKYNVLNPRGNKVANSQVLTFIMLQQYCEFIVYHASC